MADGWAQLRAGAGSRQPVRHSAGRRWATAIIILLVAALVVVGGAFLAESLARGITEDAVEDAVESNLPDNVDATVDADVAGDWVIVQLLSGRMAEVTISSDDARFEGMPVDQVTVTASGVPVDLKSPVDAIKAAATLDEAALNELLTLPGNDPDLSLGDGTVSYDDMATVFGFDIGFLITASLTPDGTDVLVTSEEAQITSSAGVVDVSTILDRLLGSEPLRVCLADRLPDGVTISGIDVQGGAATLSLAAKDFTLSESALRSTGECAS